MGFRIASEPHFISSGCQKKVPLSTGYTLFKFWILDFGFWIGGIAALYPFIKQTKYLKSKIRIPNSKIYLRFIIDMKSCLKRIVYVAFDINYLLRHHTYTPAISRNSGSSPILDMCRNRT